MMSSDFLFSSFSKDLGNIDKVLDVNENLEFEFIDDEVIFKNYQISSKLIINTDYRLNKFLKIAESNVNTIWMTFSICVFGILMSTCGHSSCPHILQLTLSHIGGAMPYLIKYWWEGG